MFVPLRSSTQNVVFAIVLYYSITDTLLSPVYRLDLSVLYLPCFFRTFLTINVHVSELIMRQSKYTPLTIAITMTLYSFNPTADSVLYGNEAMSIDTQLSSNF